ncbi:hypothetical protein [Kitasatospora sp. MBT66]|uniref:hypothetical protein n=1 Tax=Kitasatospora sp. MBT66 TaxID=1444769 RepID=UPI0005B81437|nr:hypothetical protein [Kitasatospora sp. MBT66]
MSDHNDDDATAAEVRAWPDPTDEQLSLVARILGPHIRRARADRLAAEKSAGARPNSAQVAA